MVEIRYQQIGDAKRFFEILSHPDFIYFPVTVKNIEEEKAFLRQNRQKRKDGTEHNFAISYEDELVGAIGLMVDRRRAHVGEIGYFVDQNFWGKGIASAAVKLIERFAMDELSIARLEIVILKQHTASQRVAEKCGYLKECVQRGKLLHEGKHADAYLFAKVIA
jgi:ribosomal-protein-alanine N-acetyltransferase